MNVDQVDHPCQEANLDTNSPDDPWTRSQLFTVRLWYESVDAGQWEVRMQAKHIDPSTGFLDRGIVLNWRENSLQGGCNAALLPSSRQ